MHSYAGRFLLLQTCGCAVMEPISCTLHLHARERCRDVTGQDKLPEDAHPAAVIAAPGPTCTGACKRLRSQDVCATECVNTIHREYISTNLKR